MTVYYLGWARSTRAERNKSYTMPRVNAIYMQNPFTYKFKAELMKQGFSEEDMDTLARDKVREIPEFKKFVKQTIDVHKGTGEVVVLCKFGKHRSFAIAHEAAKQLGVQAAHLREAI